MTDSAMENTIQIESTASVSASKVGLSPWIPNRRGVLCLVLIGALIILAAGCGGVTEDREDSFAVGESPTLVVNNENGFIKVNAEDDNTIRVQTRMIRPSRDSTAFNKSPHRRSVGS